jgi:hypothetical protein
MTILHAEVAITSESDEVLAGSFEKESYVGKCSLGTEHCTCLMVLLAITISSDIM